MNANLFLKMSTARASNLITGNAIEHITNGRRVLAQVVSIDTLHDDASKSVVSCRIIN
jgi:hypothetical protein